MAEFCEVCGSKINPGAAFCSSCGARVETQPRVNDPYDDKGYDDRGYNDKKTEETGGPRRQEYQDEYRDYSPSYADDYGKRDSARYSDRNDGDGEKKDVFIEAGKTASYVFNTGMDKIKKGIEVVKEREDTFTNRADDVYAGGDNGTITGVRLVHDEKIVRTYHCTTYGYIFRREGYLTVTNKRVIFESVSLKSRIVNEIALDSVSGFRNFYGTNIFILGMIIGIAIILTSFGALGMIPSLRDVPGVMLGVLLGLAFGGLIIFFSIRRNIVISVFSSKAGGVPIDVGEGPKTLFGNSALYSVVGRPTSETNSMMREIGAMVQDLQTRGDHAIDDWVV